LGIKIEVGLVKREGMGKRLDIFSSTSATSSVASSDPVGFPSAQFFNIKTKRIMGLNQIFIRVEGAQYVNLLQKEILSLGEKKNCGDERAKVY
jgi:hypothetical protein